MRRGLFVFLILSMLSAAALDQSYVQTVSRDGSSTIWKTMDLTIFANQLPAVAMQRMYEVCKSSPEISCDVDVEGKKVTISDSFTAGSYYTYSSDYGIPYITHTLTINQVPNDRFTVLLNKLLLAANTTASGGAAARPISLRDTAANAQTAAFLRQFNISITYTANMPQAISDAGPDAVINGSSASFDLGKVMEHSTPLIVRSSELNVPALIVIAAVIVLGALTLSFFGTKASRTKKK
jgi:hypothetical protein